MKEINAFFDSLNLIDKEITQVFKEKAEIADAHYTKIREKHKKLVLDLQKENIHIVSSSNNMTAKIIENLKKIKMALLSLKISNANQKQSSQTTITKLILRIPFMLGLVSFINQSILTYRIRTLEKKQKRIEEKSGQTILEFMLTKTNRRLNHYDLQKKSSCIDNGNTLQSNKKKNPPASQTSFFDEALLINQKQSVLHLCFIENNFFAFLERLSPEGELQRFTLSKPLNTYFNLNSENPIDFMEKMGQGTRCMSQSFCIIHENLPYFDEWPKEENTLSTPPPLNHCFFSIEETHAVLEKFGGRPPCANCQGVIEKEPSEPMLFYQYIQKNDLYAIKTFFSSYPDFDINQSITINQKFLFFPNRIKPLKLAIEKQNFLAVYHLIQNKAQIFEKEYDLLAKKHKNKLIEIYLKSASSLMLSSDFKKNTLNEKIEKTLKNKNISEQELLSVLILLKTESKAYERASEEKRQYLYERLLYTVLLLSRKYTQDLSPSLNLLADILKTFPESKQKTLALLSFDLNIQIAQKAAKPETGSYQTLVTLFLNEIEKIPEWETFPEKEYLFPLPKSEAPALHLKQNRKCIL